jgi:hypothetical protein
VTCSTFTLTDDPENDQFKEVYFHVAIVESVEVIFVKAKRGSGFTIIVVRERKEG